MKFLDLCLEGKYETICCIMYLGKQSVYLKASFDGWRGGTMKSFKSFESGQQFF
jgi:hypothetical protein